MWAVTRPPPQDPQPWGPHVARPRAAHHKGTCDGEASVWCDLVHQTPCVLGKSQSLPGGRAALPCLCTHRASRAERLPCVHELLPTLAAAPKPELRQSFAGRHGLPAHAAATA